LGLNLGYLCFAGCRIGLGLGFRFLGLGLRFVGLGFRFACPSFRSLKFLRAIFRFGLLARFDLVVFRLSDGAL
jgi:hypothetical protein